MRLVLAAAQAVGELGGGAAVVDIVSRAGVSRKTFYEIFADRDQCLLAAFDQALAAAAHEALPAWSMQASWVERIRGALAGILAFLDSEPTFGNLLLGDSTGVLLHRRSQVLLLLAGAVDEGRLLGKAPGGVTSLTAEGVVGAILTILQARRLADKHGPVSGLLGELMAIVVLPYLGPAAAARQRRRDTQRRHAHPAAVPVAPVAAPVANPFKDLGIRLTYRTVRVLSAVALLAEEGSSTSNTQIARDAGVADLGQMSKLLARLSRVGLLENTASAASKGEAYAWRLTERGQQVYRAIDGRQALDA